MDIILYNILIGFCCFFFGYIFGSIPNGVIIGKIFYKKDPRKEGSKNSGGTNVGRLFGKKAGLAVIILDMFKSVIPTLVIYFILKYSGLNEFLIQEFGQGFYDAGVLFIYLTPIGVAIGHCWPLFANFKGGKTVAVFCGFAIMSSWALIVLGAIVFFGMLKIKKYVSLASMMTATIVTAFTWIIYGLNFIISNEYQNIIMWGNGNFLIMGWEFSMAISVIAILLIYRHKANIVRLVKHQENKIKWMK